MVVSHQIIRASSEFLHFFIEREGVRSIQTAGYLSIVEYT